MNGITLHNIGEAKIELANDFLVLRTDAIKEATKIKAVTSLPMEGLAVEALSGIQRLIRDMEKCRVDVKSKPLAICKEIDAIAKTATEPLLIEEKRLKSSLGAFAEVKRLEAEEMERVRQEELRKIQEAQRLEEEKAEKAAQEQARLEEQALLMAQKAANATNEKQRMIAEQAAARARQLAEEQANKLAQAAMEAQAKEDAIRESMPITTAKASGAVTKFTLKYQVVDIHEFFKAYPNYCEITEKRSAVNSLIAGMNITNPNELPKIKGLRVYREANVTSIAR